MRKLLLSLALLLGLSVPAQAGNGNTVLLLFPGVPTGSCAFIMLAIDNSTGILYDCDGGSWNEVGPGVAGATSWSSLTDPTGSIDLLGNAVAEIMTWDFQANYTNEQLVLMKTSTGTPSGGTLLTLEVHDDDVTPLIVSDGTTNVFSVARTGNVVSPLWNNVRVVDGVKFTTIQAAHDALPSAGGIVFVPEGTEAQGATTLTISKNNVTLIGAGMDATIVTFTLTSGASVDITGQFVKIQGMTFRGPCTSFPCAGNTANGLHWHNTDTGTGARPQMQSVLVDQFGAIGIFLDSTTGPGNLDLGSFIDVRSRDNGSDGWKTTGTDVNGMAFINTDGSSNVGWGYNIETSGNTFMSAHADNNGAGCGEPPGGCADDQAFRFEGDQNTGTVWIEGSNAGNLTFTANSEDNLIHNLSGLGVGAVSDSGTNNWYRTVRTNPDASSVMRWNALQISRSGAEPLEVVSNSPQVRLEGNDNKNAGIKLLSRITGVSTPAKTIQTLTDDLVFVNNAGSIIFKQEDAGKIILDEAITPHLDITANNPQVLLTGKTDVDAFLRLTSGQSAATLPIKSVGTSTDDFVVTNNAGSVILRQTDAGDLTVTGDILDPTINDVLFFVETAGDDPCAAGDYWQKGNSTSGKMRGCENGTAFDVNTAGGGNSFGTIGNAVADSGADTLTVTDSGRIDFTTTNDPEDLTADIVADSVDATYIDETDAYTWTGLHTFVPSGLGGLTDYDASFGDTDGSPTYGIGRFGNSIFGRTSFIAGSLDLDGAILSQNAGGPVTSSIEFAWQESGTSIRFAIPTSGADLGTYTPRSLIVAGPAPADSNMVNCDTWTTTNGNIDCDTAGTGADLFVQDDAEIEGTVFFHESLISAAGNPADAGVLRLGNAEIIGWELATPGADRELTVTANDRLAFNGLDCSAGDQYITANAAGEFICGTDDGGGSVEWSALIDPTGAMSMTSSTVTELMDWDYQANYTAELLFDVRTTTGTPSGGVLANFQVHDSDVTVFRAWDGTDGVQVSGAGALAIVGSGTITATDLAAGAVAATTELAAGLCGANTILERQAAVWACIATPAGGNVDLLDGSVHQDTTAGSVTQGGLVVGQTATPEWTLLTIGAADTFLGSDNTDATWTSLTLASAQFVNQGTTTTVAHGNASGNPSWGSVVPGDMDLTQAYAFSGTSNTFIGASYTDGSGAAAGAGVLRCANAVACVAAEAAPAGTDGTITYDVTEQWAFNSPIVVSSGGTDQVQLGSGTNLSTWQHTFIEFEGSTDDGFETTFNITDPTADRAVTVPNADTVLPQAQTCTNEFLTALNGTTGALTCTAATLASAQFANQGTTTTLLHGNASGNPSWSGVDLANDTVANQGTTTTLLHGNAGGQPSFGSVVAADLGAGFVDATTDLAAGLCASGQILERQGAVWACITTPSGGAVRWDELTDPTAATTFTGSAVAETLDFDFQANYTAEILANFRTTTGTPSGGVILNARTHDADMTIFRAWDGTDGVAVDGSGNLAVVASGTITATDLAADTLDATTEIAGTLCGTDQILEDQGAAWACIDTPTGGGSRWDELTDPTGAMAMNSGTNTELLEFNYTSALGATDVAFQIEQLTGDPVTGSILLELTAADADILLLSAGGATIDQAGAMEAPSWTGTGPNGEIAFPNSAAGASDASEGNLRYDSASQNLQLSENTGGYSSVAAASKDMTWTGQHDFDSAEILSAGAFRFEGSTDNDTYTTLTITDPGSARTWTVPDADSIVPQTYTCTNEFATALASPTGVTSCTTATLASAQFANQGTTTTVLHGNAAGNPSWAGIDLANDTTANQGTTTTLLHGDAAGQPAFGAVVSADLNITATDCTNQYVQDISSAAAGACTTVTLASADFVNQGTTITLLHGDAAGNPTWAAVDLANEVTGELAAGSYAAASIDSDDVATPLKTFDKSIVLIDPTTGEDDKIQWMHGKAVTYTDVDCSTDAGTVTIDMDHRVITTPNTVGTDILTGTIICDTDNQADGGFADATIPANVPVNLSITAVSGAGTVRIHIRGTVDP